MIGILVRSNVLKILAKAFATKRSCSKFPPETPISPMVWFALTKGKPPSNMQTSPGTWAMVGNKIGTFSVRVLKV